MKGACLVIAVLMLSVTGIAQTAMTGKVSDSNGKPVAGASVQIKGKNTGTTTDGSGSFRLQLRTGDTLVLSSVGFETQQIVFKTVV